ncbi:hypothetical protein ACIS_00962 [Anaplasma centrale str. Israel]|uniref:Uncharacterized protein n=1 Tax=Anaplasma centrale (strain Israel) TaxID=574556 RepID=D1ASK8_ANACI|nr:hypothetical protein ACIS_00962 [Anaplasma centrale str. Israel]
MRAGWTAGRFELLGVITEWAWSGYVEFSGTHDRFRYCPGKGFWNHAHCVHGWVKHAKSSSSACVQQVHTARL